MATPRPRSAKVCRVDSLRDLGLTGRFFRIGAYRLGALLKHFGMGGFGYGRNDGDENDDDDDQIGATSSTSRTNKIRRAHDDDFYDDVSNSSAAQAPSQNDTTASLPFYDTLPKRYPALTKAQSFPRHYALFLELCCRPFMVDSFEVNDLVMNLEQQIVAKARKRQRTREPDAEEPPAAQVEQTTATTATTTATTSSSKGRERGVRSHRT